MTAMQQAFFPAPPPPPERPHTLTVVRDDDGELEMHIACPGLTWRCEGVTECQHCPDLEAEGVDVVQEIEATGFAHGEHHLSHDEIDGYGVSIGCYVGDADDLHEQGEIVSGGQPGTYAVFVSFDDSNMTFTLVPDQPDLQSYPRAGGETSGV